jgi:hypothetical protein
MQSKIRTNVPTPLTGTHLKVTQYPLKYSEFTGKRAQTTCTCQKLLQSREQTRNALSSLHGCVAENSQYMYSAIKISYANLIGKKTVP